LLAINKKKNKGGRTKNVKSHEVTRVVLLKGMELRKKTTRGCEVPVVPTHEGPRNQGTPGVQGVTGEIGRDQEITRLENQGKGRENAGNPGRKDEKKTHN